MLLGIFPSAELTQPSAIGELAAIDAWTAAAGGSRTTIAGTFIDLEVGNPNFNVIEQLEAAWAAGTTPLVKTPVQRTAKAIADGAADAGITGWARAYAAWTARGGGRFAFLAPLPEANYVDSAPYTLDPENFKKAYRRIVDIFEREGASRSKVRWVFAPNGFTDDGDPEWEEYYPGDAVVDVVGFSQYNWGFCPGLPYDVWLDPTTIAAKDNLFGKYIARMKALAPNRPIFVLQVATSSHFPAKGTLDPAKKNSWLRNTYGYFADQGVAAVMYFNRDKECDWAIFKTGGASSAGYRDAASDPATAYIPPAELSARTLPGADGCTPGATTHCLQGGRFRVEVRWLDSNTGETVAASAVPQRTPDSGLFRFWDANNWEILVKVLDGCGANGNGRFWVYSAAATDRAFTLVVTDTLTGASRSYANPQGKRATPTLDAQAFATCGSMGFGAGSPSTGWGGVAEPYEEPTVSAHVAADAFDPSITGTSGAPDLPAAGEVCKTSSSVACLQAKRFKVEIDWVRTSGAEPESATLAPVGTSDSGLFTFYGTNNWEILVKVLNGCGANGNGHYWVFAAAATDRGFDIRVTDTATGAQWSKQNPFGTVPQAIGDTTAFATCP